MLHEGGREGVVWDIPERGVVSVRADDGKDRAFGVLSKVSKDRKGFGRGSTLHDTQAHCLFSCYLHQES